MTRKRIGIKTIVVVFVSGIFLMLATYREKEVIPPFSDLVSVSGVLISIEENRKRPLYFELEGHEKRFGYQSFGGMCGVMGEKLRSLIGRQITIYHDPSLRKPLLSDDYHSVYEFRSNGRTICSYFDVYSMRERNESFGFFFGVCIVVLSLTWLGFWMLEIDMEREIKLTSETQEDKRLAGKNEEDDRERKALEEGERVIGDQWKR